MDDKLKASLERFLEAFETVFDKDWVHTKEMLGVYNSVREQEENAEDEEDDVIYIISPDGTFLKPNVDDETEDWGYRGELPAAYRQLKEQL
jgi:hypothetical protein